jgi:Ser/Thr protein kinase RdoA (MazF antagonist)
METLDSAPSGAASAPQPFSGLTPDRILDALDSVGLRGDGRLLALNSYENRVYQVYLEDPLPGEAGASGDPAVVVKFYRSGRWSDAAILEEHQFLAALAGAEVPVVPPIGLPDGVTRAGQSTPAKTLQYFEGLRFSVYRRRGGRAPELDDPQVLTWLGRFLGRVHAIGAAESFACRPVLDVRSHAEQPRDLLLAGEFIPQELREVYRGVADQAISGARRVFERVPQLRVLRVHGDFHAGNILWTDRGPHIVDFDDTCTAPAIQDLWMLLSGDRDAMGAQIQHVLAGYEQFFAFDPVELQLIEPLRTLRMMHYAAWIARRWDDPAFPAAFPWFNTQRYWQDHILALREQIAMMDEPPIALPR